MIKLKLNGDFAFFDIKKSCHNSMKPKHKKYGRFTSSHPTWQTPNEYGKDE